MTIFLSLSLTQPWSLNLLILSHVFVHLLKILQQLEVVIVHIMAQNRIGIARSADKWQTFLSHFVTELLRVEGVI